MPDKMDHPPNNTTPTNEQQQNRASDTDAAAAAAADPNANTPTGNEHINIKVRDSHNNELFFKIKPRMRFEKIMTAFCDRLGMNFETARFLFEDVRVTKGDTPAGVSYLTLP